MIIRYRQETGPDTYNEFEFEGTLAEAGEVARAVNEAHQMWKTAFGDDGSFWQTLKGIFNI